MFDYFYYACHVGRYHITKWGELCYYIKCPNNLASDYFIMLKFRRLGK